MGTRSQTHCKHGHALDAINTAWVNQNGVAYRRCRTCHRARQRQARGSSLDPEAPALSRREVMQQIQKAYRQKKNAQCTASAQALWGVYQAQRNGKESTPLCQHNHPRSQENALCRWGTTARGTPYVLVSCRICAALRVHPKRQAGISVFDASLRPRGTPKDQERQRIDLALIAYRKKQRP